MTGVDISEASLGHQRYLQERHELKTSDVQRRSPGDVAEIGASFGSRGVPALHHLEDPDEGARALANVLTDDGVLVGMVYAAMRRTGVYMMQELFKKLGVR